MAREIDEKIVRMTFEGSKFFDEASKVVSTVDQLNASVDSLGNDPSVFDPLITAVDSAGKHFSAFEAVAVGALMRIGNRAADAAINLTKSLSVDQVSAGWAKFEEKTRAVQTIMSATGDSIDTVNDYLSKLMWYTDETSYNFVDMTSNIGKFTAQGVKLEDATTAMMGISNWAAQAGQGVNEASRAMYNLSQALGMGKVRLMDWMSVENANMGTKQFKELVIETAIELGTLSEAAETAKGDIVTFGNFRDTLSQDWFTSDVLIAALKKYGDYSEQVYQLVQEEGLSAAEAMARLSDSYEGVGKAAFEAAQVSKTFSDVVEATKDAVSSGWLQTFELLFGNLEQQKTLWTDVTGSFWDLFAASGEARNALLEDWRDIGGQLAFADVINEILQRFIDLQALLGAGWSKAFPPATAESLMELTVNIRNFVAGLELTETAAENISDAIGGVLSVFRAFGKIVGAVFAGLVPAGTTLNAVGGSLVSFAGEIGRTLTKVSEFIASEEHLAAITKSVGDVFKSLVNIFVGIAEAITGADVNADGVVTTFQGVFQTIKDGISSTLDSAGGFLDIFTDIFQKGFEKVSEFFRGSEGEVSWLDNLSATLANVTGQMGNTVPILTTFVTALGSLIDVLSRGLVELSSHIVGTVDWNQIFGLTELILVFGVLHQLNKSNPIAEVTGILDGIKDAIGGFKQKLQMDALKQLAQAIAILAGAVVMLGSMPIANAVVALAALTGIGFGLYKFLESFGEIEEEEIGKIQKMIPPLVGMSAALSLLLAALSSLAKQDIDGIVASFIALSGMMVALTLFSDAMSSVKIDPKSVAALNVMVLAIDMLVPAMMLLSLLDLEGVMTALLALAGVLTEIGLFSKAMSGITIDPKMAVGLILLGSAIGQLSASVVLLGAMDLASIGKALVGLAGLLAEIGVFSKLMSGSAVDAIGLSMAAIAIDALVVAMVALGQLNLSQIGVALVGIAGAMTIMTVAMIALGAASPASVAAAAALSGLAVAITLLTPALMLLSRLDMAGIGKSLLAVAGVVGIFVAAMYLLTPVSGVLLTVAAAFSAVALAAAALVAAFSLLGTSLVTLGAGIVLFGSMAPETVKQAMDNIKTVLDEMVGWIIKNYMKWKLASLTLFAAFIDALVELSPGIVNGVLSILNDILGALARWAPELYQNLMTLLEVFDEYAIPLGEKAVDLVLHFIEGLIRGLQKHLVKAVDAFKQAASDLWNAFKNSLFGSGSDSVENAAGRVADQAAAGLKEGVKRNERGINLAGHTSGKAYKKGFDDEMGIASPSEEMIHRAGDVAEGYKKGTDKNLFKFSDSGKKSASEYLKEFKDSLLGEGKSDNVQSVGDKTGDAFATSVEKSGAGTKAAKAISKQIDEDKEIEKAAKEKAKKVAEAFTTEFNKISSQLSAVGSKFGIAEAYLGPEDEQGKIAKQKQLLELQKMQEELQLLANKYNISWDKYQTTLANPKSTNEEVQSMYAEYLSVYEELAKKALDITNQQKELYGTYEAAEKQVMAELQELSAMQAQLVNSAEVEASKATQEAYNNFVAAVTEEQKQYYYELWNELKKQDAEAVLGDIIAKPIDPNQIRQEVYTRLGLDPNNPIASFMSVEDLINQAVAASQQTYLTAVEETYPAIIQSYESKLAESASEVLEFVDKEVTPDFKRAGEAMPEAVSDGIEISASKVSYSGQAMSRNAAFDTSKENDQWVAVGEGMINGIIRGIENRRSAAIEAAIEVALAALAAAKNALGIASPSREFLAVGMYAMDGLRIGIMEAQNSTESASRDVANGVVDQFGDLRERVSGIMDDTLHPVIDPSIDLTGVKRAVRNLDHLWSSTTLQTLGDISLSELDRRDELIAMRQPVTPVVTNTNNFTQNNYSPKALSDAEIYMQTKKELDWAFKGAKR